MLSFLLNQNQIMKTKFIKSTSAMLFVYVGILFGIVSCKKDEHVPILGEEVRASLQFTELLGTKGAAHGNHFHGVSSAKEGAVITINFDASGNAMSNDITNLNAELAYKMDLKIFDESGAEIQQQYVENLSIAENYKAFLTADNLIANANSETNGGAIFQPRDTSYTDGTKVNGQYEMTGLISFFTLGLENKGKTKNITYSLRKIEPGVKVKIERADLLDQDYANKFNGKNILELKFNIR